MKLLFNENPYASQAMEQDNQLGKYLKGLQKESSPAGIILVLNIFQQLRPCRLMFRYFEVRTSFPTA